MTNEQILKRAISKAVKNGWEFPVNQSLKIKPNQAIYDTFKGSQNDIIFNSDFAKAFWGTKSIHKGKWKICDEWQRQLQYLVILSEDERFDYLEQFL